MEAETSGSISSFAMNFKANLEQFMTNLKILTASDIQALVSMPNAIEAVHRAYASIAAGTTTVPLRIDVDQSTHQSHTFFMPALVDNQHLGMKIHNLMARVFSLIVLSSLKSTKSGAKFLTSMTHHA
jgi:hypothetical protein